MRSCFLLLLFHVCLLFSSLLPARTQTIEVDRIAAVVGNDAITLSELKEQSRAALSQLRRQGTPLPPEDVFEQQMLERMIMDRAQTQLAREYGITIDEEQLDQAISRIAARSSLNLGQFKTMLSRDGISFASFREDIRNEMVISRLRDREVDSRVVITDAEIDNYLEQMREPHEEYWIAHILLRIPETTTPEQLQKLKSKADNVRQKATSGENFSELAAAYSDAQDALQGGDLGWRAPDKLPAVFLEAVEKMKTGSVSSLLQSPNGFHILKLLGRRGGETADEDSDNSGHVRQTHARHILLRTDEVISEAEARRRLNDLRERLQHGEDFAELARLYSQDGSAANGGDLGWINPGDTVPEFERIMDQLAEGVVSEVTQSPFGFHLILVEARRLEDMRDEKRRLAARQAIRERKLEDAYQDWLRQLRDKTYVEYRLENE